jgi:uncharacterized membrane protein
MEGLMAAKAYTVLVGLLLLVVGVLGLTGRVPLPAHHNWVHVVSGVVALGVAIFASSHARTFAQVFGAIYVLLAVLGFAGISNLGPLHLMLNAAPVLYIHSAVGLAGLLAGFVGKKKAQVTQMKNAA